MTIAIERGFGVATEHAQARGETTIAPSWDQIGCTADTQRQTLAPNPAGGQRCCRLTNRSVDQVRPHESYVKHKLSVSASQLSTLIAAGDSVFQQPIFITTSGTIIDGYARWELAKQRKHQTILCLEYEISEEEALRRLIQAHMPSKGMNGFCRAELASDLEPALRESARSNQQQGGRNKRSSTLTEAQSVDTRSHLASLAKVSAGQFTKTKQVLASGPPAVQDAVKTGEISVHQAWQWRWLSAPEQLGKLGELRSRKGTNRTSSRLIQKHLARMRPTRLIPLNLKDVLNPALPDQMAILTSIFVSEIDLPGRIAYFTKEALRSLSANEAPNGQREPNKAHSRRNKNDLGSARNSACSSQGLRDGP